MFPALLRALPTLPPLKKLTVLLPKLRIEAPIADETDLPPSFVVILPATFLVKFPIPLPTIFPRALNPPDIIPIPSNAIALTIGPPFPSLSHILPSQSTIASYAFMKGVIDSASTARFDSSLPVTFSVVLLVAFALSLVVSLNLLPVTTFAIARISLKAFSSSIVFSPKASMSFAVMFFTSFCPIFLPSSPMMSILKDCVSASH